MGRRRAASDVTDPDTGKKLTRREIQEWKDKGRQVWWYVVNTGAVPYDYWNETHKRWVGSFRGSATQYRTREKAEKVAVLVAASHPALFGKVDVIER